jgi:hypothetical protein
MHYQHASQDRDAAIAGALAEMADSASVEAIAELA